MKWKKLFWKSSCLACLCSIALLCGTVSTGAVNVKAFSVTEFGEEEEGIPEQEEQEEEGETPTQEEQPVETPEPTAQPEETGTVIALGAQQGDEEIRILYGDRGRFTLDMESENSVFKMYRDKISYAEYELLDENDEEIIAVDESGTFSANGFGTAAIKVVVYDTEDNKIEEIGERFFYATVWFDIKKVRAEKKKFVVYQSGFDENPEHSFETKLIGLPESINKEETYGLGYDTFLEEDALGLSTVLYNGKLRISLSGVGKFHLTVTMLEKEFKFTIVIKEVKLKGSTDFYMTPKQGKQLKLKNGKGAVWKSSDNAVVSVTKKGKIKARKIGNAVISAKVQGVYTGCVISVVSKSRLQVIKRARYIGKNWTYSQPKRMQKGFYDCSSLVWKAYSLEKRYFGSRSYAPVAADIAKYCVAQKKEVKGDAWKKIQRMKFRPGALTFKMGPNNGRYKNIYHVEMFLGYALYGFNSKGKPYLGTKWGARENDYEFGEIWVQL